uniref:Uncharacterized protein n=1 Tax=Leersia perrieri TaxID=77586 RepID=A0A0D9V478_9ORYZ
MEQESVTALATEQEEAVQLGEGILHHFEQILHQDPLIDEVGFLHPTQFQALEHSQTGDWTSEAPECPWRYFWCKDHKLAISMEILPKLYRAARLAYTNSAAAKDGPLMETDLMRHSKALLILCPDMLTAWNSRRWVIKKVSEHDQDDSELIERESLLVKEIAEKSKMNYRAWRHRCWLIPYMTRKQSLLLALLDSCHVEDTEDILDRKSEVQLMWKEELAWNEMLIRRYQGREV